MSDHVHPDVRGSIAIFLVRKRTVVSSDKSLSMAGFTKCLSRLSSDDVKV